MSVLSNRNREVESQESEQKVKNILLKMIKCGVETRSGESRPEVRGFSTPNPPGKSDPADSPSGHCPASSEYFETLSLKMSACAFTITDRQTVTTMLFVYNLISSALCEAGEFFPDIHST